MEFEEYLSALASEAPTPGGGSAATIVVTLGAALVAMVARLTLKNARLARVHELARELVLEADRVRAQALQARTEDETAYGDVVTAAALPKASLEERAKRTSALQRALAGAARAPLRAAELAKLVAVLAARSLELGNAQLASDVGCAVEFAQAALAAAAFNVRVNYKFLKDREAILAGERELALYESEVALLVTRVRGEVAKSLAP